VLRYSNDEVSSDDNPEETMRGLNKQVVYHQAKDDITKIITSTLNKRYDQTAAHTGDAAPATR
jgi:hypothetical protein